MTGSTTVSAVRAAIALFTLSLATTAHAQAWLPAKGEGTVSVLFSNTLSTRHYLPDVAYDRGHIDANTMLFDVTYGLTDRMAVTVHLMNGRQIEAHIKNFDRFAVIVEVDGCDHLVFKHAIAAIETGRSMANYFAANS